MKKRKAPRAGGGMSFEACERRAREIFDAIPDEMRHGVTYLVVSEEAVPHPDVPDVYTLGECATGEYDLGFDAPGVVRSGVHLYHGSFVKLAELDPEFDWEAELEETIVHEVRHHRESTAGEDALEDMDYAEDENFKRREGQPFDPLFYRAGHPVAGDAWEVDGDLFVERVLDTAEFERDPELTVTVEGEELVVPRPERLGDVHYVYLDGLYEDEAADVALVLVRRRSGWESLRGLFRRREPEVLESSVDFAGEEGEGPV
jgi:predicted Zn-dependent protease with MMP-like domain